MDDVTVEEMAAALRAWPREEREFVAKLTEREARLIGEAAVLLGLHPLPKEKPSARGRT